MAHLIKLFDKAGASDKIAKDAAFTGTLIKKAKVPTSALGKEPTKAAKA